MAPYEGLGATRNDLAHHHIVVPEPQDVHALMAHMVHGTPLPPPHVKDNYLQILRWCEVQNLVIQTWDRAFVPTPPPLVRRLRSGKCY